MNKNVKDYLIKHIEPSIVNLFLLNDLGTLINPNEGYLFENFEPKESIVKKVLGSAIQYTDTFLEDLIDIFPEDYRCDKQELLSRLKAWNNKTSVSATPQEILNAAVHHIRKYDTPYHGQLKYFIFKMQGSIYSSRLDSALQELAIEHSSTWGDYEETDSKEPTAFEL